MFTDIITTTATTSTSTSTSTTLPLEIIQLVLEELHVSNDKKTLASCAIASKALYSFALPLLYHSVQITTPVRYTRFASTSLAVDDSTSADLALSLVRELDFSGYTTFGTRRADASKIVTPQTLMDIFSACDGLERIVLAESIEKALTADVLKTIMFYCRQLKSLEFIGMSSPSFSAAMSELIASIEAASASPNHKEPLPLWSSPANSPSSSRRNSLESKSGPSSPIFAEPAPQWPTQQAPFPVHLPVSIPRSLTAVSFHQCPTLSDSTILHPFLALLPQNNVTHLDLTGTKLTDRTLLSHLDLAGNLTHLALSKCKNLSAQAMSFFVAGCKKLEYLNLYSDPSSAISNGLIEEDLFNIISSLPKSIRHIDIGSANCTELMLQAFTKFTPNLEKLGIAGAHVSFEALEKFLTSNKGLLSQLQTIDLSNIPAFATATHIQLTSFLNILKTKTALQTVELSAEVYDRIAGYQVGSSGRRRWISLRELPSPCESILERKICLGGKMWRGEKIPMSSVEKYYTYSI